MVQSIRVLVAGFVLLVGVQRASAADTEKMTLLQNPEAIQWGPAPPTLPKSTKVAVLAGDPSKSGIFVLRIWSPPGTVVAPHTHKTAEIVTVISGTLYQGMGEKLDKNNGEKVQAGGFIYLPADMAHSAWTKDETTVVEVTGMGPFGINYINPADDPSKQQ
jgi:quercetin dioxygenase-like cupin family protein